MFGLNRLSREELERRAKARKLRGLFLVSNDDYHAGPGWSSTRLKQVLQSPAHAGVPIEDTPSLRFGRAVHAAILEPEVFLSSYVIKPSWPKFAHDGRTKDGKAERGLREADEKHWHSLHGTKAQLSVADWQDIMAMLGASHQSKTFRSIMEGAQFEIACYWIDPDTGVLCKAKADIWRSNLLADVKTTTDASLGAFRRAVVDYDYDLSASFYSDGFAQILGHPMTFVWIAMEKQAPYGVAFYVADEEMQAQGRELYKQALTIVAAIPQARDGMPTLELPCYPDEIQAISPTAYARNRINENLVRISP